MAIKHQDLKNLVIQELLNESINNEGVIDWVRAQSSKAASGAGKALSGAGKALSGAGEKLKPGDPQIAKKLEKVGDFLQMAQRDKDITQLIMQTDLGKKVFSSQEKSLEEALGQDFVKMMKDKKVTPQEVEAFVAAMNKNKKAKQMLDGLGLDIEAGKQQGAPADATAQTQAQPVAGQQQAGADNVIAVFKGKSAGPNGASDSLQTQLIRQFGSKIPDGGKLITAITKDLMNQLKVNGLKVQESVEQVEQFLLKELIDNKLEHQSLSYLLKENNSLDYRLTSQILESLQEGREREKKRKEEHVRQLGFVFDNGEVNWKAFTAAVKDAKQKGEVKDDDEFVINGLRKRKGEGEKDLGAAAAVQNTKDAEQNNIAAAGQLAADTNPNPSQDSVIPQPAPASAPAPAPVPPPAIPPAGSEKTKELGKIGSGDSPGANYATNGFDDKQKRQVVSSLTQKGFKLDQVTKLVNGFSDWLKNRTKQQQAQPVQEGAGNSQARELISQLISQFIKETNFAADEKLRAALADQTIRTFGNPAKAMGPVRANTSAALRKAVDAAFKQITPTRPGIVNVGEVVSRKLKAIAQLNPKAGLALVPMVPKILQAIEKFIAYALAKSGKKDSVKIVGGSKNAVALQKILTNIKSKGIMSGPPEQQAKPAIQKESLKRILMEEIFNAIVGKNK